MRASALRVWAALGSVAILGGTLGAVGHLYAARANRSEPDAAFSSGSTLPNVALESIDGSVSQLTSVAKAVRPRVILVLSTTCSTCLGELNSWQEWTVKSADNRIVVLMHAPDSASFVSVVRLAAASYPIFRIVDADLRALHSMRTPTIYVLSGSGALQVRTAAVGLTGAARVRGELDN